MGGIVVAKRIVVTPECTKPERSDGFSPVQKGGHNGRQLLRLGWYSHRPVCEGPHDHRCRTNSHAFFWSS